jgi:glutathione S-transferase
VLKLYYARPSLFARPVWLTLLEKQLDFELVPMNLASDQFEPEFLNLNPFAHVPVLLDGEVRVFESLAILDYLEAKYPAPALIPTQPVTLAQMRMVQMVSVNELLPAIVKLLIQDEPDLSYPYARAHTVLKFFEQSLAGQPYFAGEHLSLADLVASSIVVCIPDLGIDLAPYPQLADWLTRLLARPSWQPVQLSPEEWQEVKRKMRVMPKLWQRRRRNRVAAMAGGVNLTSPQS